ncbi:iron-sulfur cluster co-chaperone HscB C-terminal domain-containing protein [Pedobacter cryophilus]|nr:iron-sulfur cluster co-chaperone HscB C-terminal domain-containing protein [Pedobacter cryophilus]
MNYFEFYDIPLSFHPDKTAVKKKFYALSKAYHPDFFVNESEEKQQEILQLSTLNNKAFQTLSNPDQLLAYVLAAKGELEEGEKYELPQDFLMEMMEVNEAFMELEFDADEQQLAQVKQTVEELEDSLNAEKIFGIGKNICCEYENLLISLQPVKELMFFKKMPSWRNW